VTAADLLAGQGVVLLSVHGPQLVAAVDLLGGEALSPPLRSFFQDEQEPLLSNFAVLGRPRARADLDADRAVDADLKEQHNAVDLMEKGELKTGYVVADPAKLTVGTVSIWENEDKFNAVANTDPYKALIGRLKYSTRNVYLLNLQ